ncbi:MAG: hypothetical protein HRF49_01445 [bacterium]|jgi:hypothetical protein
MLKFWTTGADADTFVLSSVKSRVEHSPCAAIVLDRSGIPHRIAGEYQPRPVRIEIEFPENALSLENTQPIRFDNLLITLFETNQPVVFFESTRARAYQGFIEELDPRIAARRDRLAGEDDFVRVVFWLERFGTYSDWTNLASVEWEDE